MALDLPLPKTVFVHNFIVMKDGKMSKSKGNVIYPETLVDKYGLDATKYALLREMPYSQDAVFSPESFVERYNFDLCNDLSNLVNRTVSMVNKYFDGKIESYNGTFNNFDKEIEDLSNNQIKLFEEKMDNFEIANALKEIWVLIARANKYIDETSPWILAKEENNQEELKSVMYHLVETLRRIAILISPFMNDTAKNIFNQLGISDELQTWDSLNNYNNLNR
jgi:methionyl-tRNA synthetase